MLQKALQMAAFLSDFYFNQKYGWTPNGYVVSGIGVVFAFTVALPFLAYAKLRWWLLSRKRVAAPVVENAVGVLHESASRPLGGVRSTGLIGRESGSGKGRRVPGFDGTPY